MGAFLMVHVPPSTQNLREVESRHRAQLVEVQREYEGQFMGLRAQMDEVRGVNRSEIERLTQELEVAKRRPKVAHVESECEIITEKMLEESEQGKRELEEKILLMKEECDGQQERISDLNVEIRDLKGEVQELRGKKDNMSKALMEQRDIQSRLILLQEQVSVKDSYIATLSQEFKAKENLSLLLLESEKTQTKLLLDKERSHLNDLLDQERQRHFLQLSELKQQIIPKPTTYDFSDTCDIYSVKEVSLLKSGIETLNRDLKSHISQIAVLEAQVDRKDEELRSQGQRIRDLEETNQILIQENRDMEALKRQLTELLTLTQTQEVELGVLRSNVDARDYVSVLMKRQQQIQIEIKISQEVAIVRNQYDQQLQSVNERLQSEREQWKQRLDNVKKESSQKIMDLVKEKSDKECECQIIDPDGIEEMMNEMRVQLQHESEIRQKIQVEGLQQLQESQLRQLANELSQILEVDLSLEIGDIFYSIKSIVVDFKQKKEGEIKLRESKQQYFDEKYIQTSTHLMRDFSIQSEVVNIEALKADLIELSLQNVQLQEQVIHLTYKNQVHTLDHQNQIVTLNAQLTLLQDLSHKKPLSTSIQTQCDQLFAEPDFADLKRDLSLRDKELNQLLELKEHREWEIDGLKQQLHEAITVPRHTPMNAEVQCELLCKEALENINEELRALNQVHQHTKNKYKKLEQTLREKEEAIVQLSEAVEQKEERLAQIQQANQALEQELIQFQDQTQIQQNRITSLFEQNQSQTQLLDEQTRQVEELQNRLRDQDSQNQEQMQTSQHHHETQHKILIDKIEEQEKVIHELNRLQKDQDNLRSDTIQMQENEILSLKANELMLASQLKDLIAQQQCEKEDASRAQNPENLNRKKFIYILIYEFIFLNYFNSNFICIFLMNHQIEQFRIYRQKFSIHQHGEFVAGLFNDRRDHPQHKKKYLLRSRLMSFISMIDVFLMKGFYSFQVFSSEIFWRMVIFQKGEITFKLQNISFYSQPKCNGG